MDDKNKIASLELQLGQERLRNKQLTAKLKAADARNKTFPFEKLPPELRNMVYEKFLTRHRRITITRRPKRHTPKAFELLSHRRWNVRKPTCLLGPRGSSLLRTNRSIYMETLPMLYGANRFQFANVAALAQFMKDTGRGASHLRDISFRDWFTDATLQRAAALFVDIGALVQYRVRTDSVDSVQTLQTRVNQIARSSATFVRLGKTQADCRRRFDILRFATMYKRGIPELEALVKEAAEDGRSITRAAAGQARFKELLHERLVKRGILLPHGVAE
ncbi:hypothetical protein LTR85_006651 [Meristemomyces frigidus]|nr:hypothetical protein LTR85_006651 [Meristemomyces frigidus]